MTAASATLIRHATVFDGTAFLDGPQDVLLRDGLIEAVGRELDAPEHSTEVEARGKTLTPGFVDAHTHLTDENVGSLQSISRPFSMQFYESVAHMRRTLQAGVTTVRDAGGADLGLKVAQESGLVLGPRLRLSINLIGQSGGHTDHWVPSGIHLPFLGEHPGRPSGVGDGPDELRKVTRLMFRAGADQIKICTTGGVLSPSDDPRHSQLTVPEIQAIVEEATAQESYVFAHAQGAAGIKNAVRGGCRSIEHAIYLDDEAIGLMLEHDTYLVPTLVAPLSVLRAGERGFTLSPAVLAKAHRVVDVHREAITRAIAAGIRIAMGTDSGVGVHGENLEELGLLVECGMSPQQALAAATSVSASLVAPDVAIGAVAAGHIADLVLFSGDLSTTAHLTDLAGSVEAVYQAGSLVPPEPGTPTPLPSTEP